MLVSIANLADCLVCRGLEYLGHDQSGGSALLNKPGLDGLEPPKDGDGHASDSRHRPRDSVACAPTKLGIVSNQPAEAT